MIITVIAAIVALVIGGCMGYAYFRYVVTGKYNQIIDKLALVNLNIDPSEPDSGILKILRK